MSVPRLPWRLNLPFQSIIQAPVLRTPSGVRNYSISKEWKGDKEHTTERSKKGDTADIHASSSASGMKERETHEGVADATKSQGTTETGGTKYGKKAKKEHPKAPEPIIGMNDERAKVSSYGIVRKCPVFMLLTALQFCRRENEGFITFYVILWRFFVYGVLRARHCLSIPGSCWKQMGIGNHKTFPLPMSFHGREAVTNRNGLPTNLE